MFPLGAEGYVPPLDFVDCHAEFDPHICPKCGSEDRLNGVTHHNYVGTIPICELTWCEDCRFCWSSPLTS